MGRMKNRNIPADAIDHATQPWIEHGYEWVCSPCPTTSHLRTVKPLICGRRSWGDNVRAIAKARSGNVDRSGFIGWLAASERRVSCAFAGRRRG